LSAAGCAAAPARPAPAPGPATTLPAQATARARAVRRVPSPVALEVIEPVARAMTAEGVRALCDENLGLAARILDEVRSLAGASPEELAFETTLGRIDDALLCVNNAAEFPYLMGVAHPEESVREAGRACEKKADALLTSLWLDRDLAAAVKTYALKRELLGPERARFLEHTLRDFRRNGLDLGAAGQQRLRAINQELTELGQKFIAEVSASRGVLEVPVASLAGLPPDYVKAHPPGPSGKVTISTDYPDYFPFVTYARDRAGARELYVKFTNRGGDANLARLDRLLALRWEKAQLLGYASWAHYAIEPRMAQTPEAVESFLARIGAAIADIASAEYDALLEEHQRAGGARGKPPTPADQYFLTDRLRSRQHKLDSQKVAEYFEVGRVTEGLLALTARMYGLEHRPVPADAWHPSVTAYEVWSGGAPLGKFYLDLFARENKYKHVAMFSVRSPKTLRPGVRQTPIAALVCNFPASGEPMPHADVVTYFHEFGHVLHHLLTETELVAFSGTNVARDFVETPSQMFEEWAWSRETLDTFARHRVTGQALPDDLFQAMASSRRLGLALATQRQLFLARLDFAYHLRPPGFDTTKLLEQIQNETFAFKYLAGTHFQTSFTHLVGYDAGYYGYQWSLALAHDVLGRFKKDGLLDARAAADWRRLVLGRGGGEDERAMVRAFLGREPGEQAYVDFLRGK
jgi:thimet oligopeptidase